MKHKKLLAKKRKHTEKEMVNSEATLQLRTELVPWKIKSRM